ncbi:hypothetical protein HAZT_HAZT006312 [Hyalella azteca]|uniref:chitinase n=1 Tax=Hyalella azteca TaxID=294128 RepID=A0A6A0HIP1_HYAAZ|nr:hypothetical protein HAZT_HAZT006312 [Hyalella azteca]
MGIPGSSHGHENNVVACFYESWSVYRPELGQFNIDDIDANLCTHISFCYLGLNEHTSTIMEIDEYAIQQGALQKLVALKEKNPSLKVTAAVGGWTEGSSKYSAMVASPGKRQTFITSVIDYLQLHKLDGLDISWQDPGVRGGTDRDKKNLVLLCQARELKAATSSLGYQVSVVVSPFSYIIDGGYDVARLANTVDLIYLAAYDYHGKWDGVTGHPAPLYPRASEGAEDQHHNVNGSVSYVLSKGVPPKMLVLGLPFFGRAFFLRDVDKNSIGSPSLQDGYQGPYTQEDGFLGYNEICEKLITEGILWTERRHPEHQVPYVYRNNVWIGYDDVVSLSDKIKLAKDFGLRGVYAWAVDTDDFRGRCGNGKFPLLTHVNEIMKDDSKSANKLPSKRPPVVACFFASWSVYRSSLGKFDISLVDGNLCTHLVFCFAGLDKETLTITDLDKDFVQKRGAYAQMQLVKRTSPDLKLTVAIGGWTERSEKFSKMAASPSLRKTFIDSVLEYLESNSLDGVDMVWQDPVLQDRGGQTGDKENYVILLQEMAAAFAGQGYHLGATVSASEEVLDASYDLSGIAAAVDIVHLIAYNYHGSWNQKTGHAAPLYPRNDETGAERTKNVDYTIKLLLSRGVPPAKLSVMLPFFARTFLLKDIERNNFGDPAFSVGFKGPYTGENGWMGFNEICEMYNDEAPIWTVKRQAEHRVPYMYNEELWFGYDNVSEIEERVRHALSYGIDAIGMWTIDTDDFTGNCGQGKYPLLNAINRILRSPAASPPDATPPPFSPPANTTGLRCSISPERDVTIGIIACADRQDLGCAEGHSVPPGTVVLAVCWETVELVMRCHGDGVWRQYGDAEDATERKMAVLCQPYYLNSEINRYFFQTESLALTTPNFRQFVDAGRGTKVQARCFTWTSSSRFRTDGRGLQDCYEIVSTTQEGNQAMDVRDLKIQLSRTLVRRVIDIRLHPEYQAGKSPVNDIALIQLEFPLKFHSKLYPACVGTYEQNPAIDAVTFNRSHGTGSYKYDLLLQRIVPDCRGSSEQKSDGVLSGGSSGGPFIQNLVSREVIEAWTVTGVTSYMSEVAGCATPRMVFTAVNVFSSWITETIQELLLLLDEIAENVDG